MSSADIRSCYPKYTQDEWDAKDMEIDRLMAGVKHASETIIREKEFYRDLLTRAADALDFHNHSRDDLIQELREAAE